MPRPFVSVSVIAYDFLFFSSKYSPCFKSCIDLSFKWDISKNRSTTNVSGRALNHNLPIVLRNIIKCGYVQYMNQKEEKNEC
jgi:hypothetical protein